MKDTPFQAANMATESSAGLAEHDPPKDLFLSYNSADRALIMDIRARLSLCGITSFFDREDLSPGLPWFKELEFALNSVSAVAVFIGRRGLGTIQKHELQFALARQAAEEKTHRAFPVIPVLTEGARPEDVSGFLALNTWVDLRTDKGNHTSFEQLVQAVRRGTGSPHSASETSPQNPYRGLQAFREEDALAFFGRDDFSERLFELVRRKPLVAVVGPSGSGKSSVVQAGLFPRLRTERPPRDIWETVLVTPGKHPFLMAAGQFVGMWSGPARTQTETLAETESLSRLLTDNGVKLSSCVDRALQNLQHANRLLLVIDQFEELFALTPCGAARKAFVDQLLNAADNSNLTILLVLRADFFGDLIDLSRALGDALSGSIVTLGPLDRSELQQAIELPARRAGGEFEAGLVNRILDAVEQQPGSLPLLEFALSELWYRRDGRRLTHDAYHASGEVVGAITMQAERTYAALPPQHQKRATEVLSRLAHVVPPGQTGADTRQAVRFRELDSEAQHIVHAFCSARLLVMNSADPSDELVVSVAHEALFRSWGRLRDWIDDNRQFLAWRELLGVFLAKWRQLNRAPDALLTGVLLKEARQWLNLRESAFTNEEASSTLAIS